MCQADGSLATLELEGSTLAGKPQWVQPKNRSQAVNMVLLAPDGVPLYLQDTHLHLTWPHNNMTSSLPPDDLSGKTHPDVALAYACINIPVLPHSTDL